MAIRSAGRCSTMWTAATTPCCATRTTWPGGSPSGRRSLTNVLNFSDSGSKLKQSTTLSSLPSLDDHSVYASDLVLTLGISEAEAEEMIFIADLKDDPKDVEPSIDFTEFKQVVVNWSN